MKSSIALIALFAVATFAGPVKFGADVLAGYNILSVGDSMGFNSSASFGVAVGPNATYSINDQFGINGGVSFLYDINGLKAKEGEVEVTFKQMSLGFQIAPVYQINEKINVKLGYEWDMPLGGTETVKFFGLSQDRDIIWAPAKGSDLKETSAPVVSTHNIILGGSFAVMPNLAVTLQGKFALRGMMAEYNYDAETFVPTDFKGAAKSKDNFSVHQIALGVNYSFN